MKPLSRVMLALASVAILAVVLPVVPAPPISAEHIAPVSISNTPLPVTGNMDVNVTNASLPVSVINTSLPITITNSPSTPLYVVDVNAPAQQPFSTDCVAEPFDPYGRSSCTFSPVPAGKRFVIETVSGDLELVTGAKPVSVHLQSCAAGTSYDHFFPTAFQGASPFFFGDTYVFIQQVRLYSDITGGCYNGAPFFNMVVTDGTSAFVTFTLSGYLINLP